MGTKQVDQIVSGDAATVAVTSTGAICVFGGCRFGGGLKRRYSSRIEEKRAG